MVPDNRTTTADGAGSPGRSRRHRTLYTLAGLTLASVILRILFFEDYTFEGTDCDAAAYMNVAQNIRSGAGWVSNSLRFLFTLPPLLPQADALWSPLYPLLTAASYAVFGTSFTSAKLVPLIFGVMVPGMIFLMTEHLTRSWKAALIAGALAVFHSALVTWSLRIETEIASTFFVGLTYFLLFNSRTAAKPYWLGIALGLAYLMKYQSLLLWPPVILFYVLNLRWQTAARRLAVVAVVFTVVISPWLVRNTLAFGSPFHSELRYNVISYYPEFGGEPRYLSSLELPVGAFEYMSTHPMTVFAFAKANLKRLLSEFFQQNVGSLVLVPFAIMGVPCMVRDWRRWVPMLLFASLLVGAVIISIPQVRYLFVLIPFWIALVAAGAGWMLALVARQRRLRDRSWRVAIWVILLLAAADETRSTVNAAKNDGALWSPSANFCALEANGFSGFIRRYTEPTETVFAPETYHYALIFGRNAVQIPFDADVLLRLREQYNIRYMVITTRDLRKRWPSWVEQPPQWVRLVLLVPADRIPRPDRNPSYGHVSELRIYEFTGESP